MTHLFYYELLTSFLANFSEKFDLLMLCGDTESNPGPRPNSGQSFSNCHWNLNSIVAHIFSRISLLIRTMQYIIMIKYVSEKPILTMTHYPTMTI